MLRKLIVVSMWTACGLALADDTPIDRGRRALLTRDYNPATWKLTAYDDAWQHWGPKPTKPEDYAQAFMDRYGLHPAPYENGRYPMGIREGTTFLGKGLTVDCMLCHGGSVAGKSYVGLGNASF